MRLAQHMNEQVESTFFLLRAVGYATFFLQPSDVQLALAVSDLPPGSIEHSERVAVTLLVFGGITLLGAVFVRPRRN